MKIERVQRWVMSSLLLLVGSMLSLGMVLAALLVIEDNRTGSKIGLLIMSTIVASITIAAVRLINQHSPLTPWLVLGLVPVVVGSILLHAS